MRADSQPSRLARPGSTKTPQWGHGLIIDESVETGRNVAGNSSGVVLVPSMYVARSAHWIDRCRARNCSSGSASGLFDAPRLNAAASVTKMVRNVYPALAASRPPAVRILATAELEKTTRSRIVPPADPGPLRGKNRFNRWLASITGFISAVHLSPAISSMGTPKPMDSFNSVMCHRNGQT